MRPPCTTSRASTSSPPSKQTLSPFHTSHITATIVTTHCTQRVRWSSVSRAPPFDNIRVMASPGGSVSLSLRVFISVGNDRNRARAPARFRPIFFATRPISCRRSVTVGWSFVLSASAGTARSNAGGSAIACIANVHGDGAASSVADLSELERCRDRAMRLISCSRSVVTDPASSVSLGKDTRRPIFGCTGFGGLEDVDILVVVWGKCHIGGNQCSEDSARVRDGGMEPGSCSRSR